MSLIINQGKQDTSKDLKNDFPIIIENNVTLQITGVSLHKFAANALNIEFKLLTGVNKGRVVFDKVDFDPKSAGSWKYRSLRSCAGVPYKENEPANIDIEALLLNKVIMGDLSSGSYTDSAGNLKEAQRIKYKKYAPNTGTGGVNPTKPLLTQTAATTNKEVKPITTAVEANDTEDPFKDIPVPDDEWD